MPSRQHLSAHRVKSALSLALLICIGSILGCTSDRSTTQSQPTTTDNTLALHATRVANYLTGSFTSSAQAKADPENYFDIHLHATPIWAGTDTATTKEQAIWLYVEQATATAIDRPYRQRIYRIASVTDPTLRSQGYTVQSEVFTLANPLRFAGAWTNPEELNTLSPSDLEQRTGCTVYLKPAETSANRNNQTIYTGSTLGTGCESTLAGAAYATSTVTIEPHRILSWDQGFDAQHNQVWGAISEGYIFIRTNKP